MFNSLYKYLLIIPTIYFISSCNEIIYSDKQISPNSKQWIIPLGDSLGNFQILLSKQFDTLITWTQYSDCGEKCAKSDYRLQNKTLPIFKESGFIYFPLNDSVEQFTIKHQKILIFPKINSTVSTIDLLDKLRQENCDSSGSSFEIDTLLNISARKFAVIAYSNFDSITHTKFQKLNALTIVNGNNIEFIFEYRKRYPDSLSHFFIKNAFESLKSIRIYL